MQFGFSAGIKFYGIYIYCVIEVPDHADKMQSFFLCGFFHYKEIDPDISTPSPVI
jgi:hypothetical protein